MRRRLPNTTVSPQAQRPRGRTTPHGQLDQATANRQRDLHVILEDVCKDANTSGIIRTAEAVGVSIVHLVRTDGLDQTILARVSRGAERWIDFEYYDEPGSCVAWLRARGITVYCSTLSSHAVDFRRVDYTRPCAIALGNENDGVSGSLLTLADERIMIPMMGLTESLNVGAAAAVILYEAQRQRALAGMYPASGPSPHTKRHNREGG